MKQLHGVPGRHGLLWRSTLAVILASVLAATVAVAYTAYVTSQRAHRSSELRLNELLDTVQSTLAVACFAKDATLAAELAQGLLSNSDVLAIRISANPELLADIQRPQTDESSATRPIERLIFSPFDRRLQVGQIVLTPDRR